MVYLTIEYNDGTLKDLEVDKDITNLDLSNRNIRRITGLEELINLERLFCYYNNISELNINNNKKLRNLFCSNNNILELNLTNLINLEELICSSNNNILELNLNNNKNLEYLNCSYNNLERLDLRANINLEVLGCNNNNISELNLNNNKELSILNCSNNNISELNLLKLINLKYLGCDNNNISELKVLEKTKFNKILYRNNPIIPIIGTNIFDNEDLYIKKYKSLNIIQGLYKRRYWKRYRKAIIIQRWIMGIGYNPYNKNCIFVRMSMIKCGIKEEDAKDIIFINNIFN